MTCTVTFDSGSPSVSATVLRAAWGFWVLAHTSQAPRWKRARATGGSMGEWGRWGTSYSASMMRAAPASARSTSPTSRSVTPGDCRARCNPSRNAAES